MALATEMAKITRITHICALYLASMAAHSGVDGSQRYPAKNGQNRNAAKDSVDRTQAALYRDCRNSAAIISSASTVPSTTPSQKSQASQPVVRSTMSICHPGFPESGKLVQLLELYQSSRPPVNRACRKTMLWKTEFLPCFFTFKPICDTLMISSYYPLLGSPPFRRLSRCRAALRLMCGGGSLPYPPVGVVRKRGGQIGSSN